MIHQDLQAASNQKDEEKEVQVVADPQPAGEADRLLARGDHAGRHIGQRREAPDKVMNPGKHDRHEDGDRGDRELT